MPTHHRVLANTYRDSVALMQASANLAELTGVDQAYLVMGAPANLAMLADAGLALQGIAADANDLVMVVQGSDPALLEQALDAAEAAIHRPSVVSTAGYQSAGATRQPPRSMERACARMPEANLALISTPGDYAAAEALKVLRLGLNVMIFSDNVTIDDEVMLKRFAGARDLLCMGPDCGTAIVDGVPLAFANAVHRGRIGLVGASGTGLQQVSCLIDRLGAGVSQAFGTGSRDLHAAVGGLTMRRALALLAADPHTDAIVLISKPPSPEVARQVLQEAAAAGKPVVVNFLGLAQGEASQPNLHFAATLAEAAVAAVALAGGQAPDGRPVGLTGEQVTEAAAVAARLTPQQRHLRGLFSGGTFCYEASLLLGQRLSPLYSNVASAPQQRLADGRRSVGHTLLDLGDDQFTRGRPHPMIDQRLRNDRIAQEAQDGTVAVILLDVVLGYGAHPDPAGEMAPVIAAARQAAARAGRHLAVVASVCGTPGDPQGLHRQEAALRHAGVVLADSSTQAALLAGEIVDRAGNA